MCAYVSLYVCVSCAALLKFSSQCRVLFLEVKASQQTGATHYADRHKLQPRALLFDRTPSSSESSPLQSNNLSFPDSLKLLALGQVEPPLTGKPGLSITAGPCGFLGAPVFAHLIRRSETEETEPGREHHLFKVN